jgi:two-component system, OmpR family, response regulator RegX3
MQGMRLLVVEDDSAIAEPLLAGLAHHGFEVKHVATGLLAIQAIRDETFDLVLLDLGLPDIDGLDVCREIRAVAKIPVIMVTARDDEVDRVVGLELGADDYVVKPFGIRELIARIRAVSRRVDATNEPSPRIDPLESHETIDAAAAMILGALTIDHRTRRVHLAGNEVSLTPKEYGVLAVLAADPGAVVARMSLIEQVWDEHWYGPTKTLDVHVAQLRQKLGDARWIETVRSVGYRLIDPATTRSDTASGTSTGTVNP